MYERPACKPLICNDVAVERPALSQLRFRKDCACTVAPNCTALPHVSPPSVDCSMRYPTIDAPPSSAGAAQFRDAPDIEAVAATDAGAVGGATGADVTHMLAAPVPAPFVAEMRNT
jgi:hypothetical protein